MRKRRSGRSKQKSREVHCVFKSHPLGESYMDRWVREATKTVIVEDAAGRKKPLSEKDIETIGIGSIQNRTLRVFLLDALKKGKRVVVGETTTRRGQRRLADLKDESEIQLLIAARTMSLPSIKRFFQTFAECERYRHKLILRTVKRTARKKGTPIELIYGTAHSLLSADLRKRGYKVTREIEPRLFNWFDIVVRKLLLGKEPTKLEYKKGFFSAAMSVIHGEFLRRNVVKKPFYLMTDKDMIFYDSVVRALLDSLTEEQIDTILLHLQDKPWLVFTLNGLPKEPTKKQLIEFLNEHSEFWQRQQRHKRAPKPE
mgnify:CR=1 FL=1